MNENFLNIADAARQIGFSRATVYRMIARGAFPAVRIGRGLRVPRGAFDVWLRDQDRAALASVRNIEVDHAHAA